MVCWGEGVYQLISLLSGCTLKAAFVSEGYFHKDVHSPHVHSSSLFLFSPFFFISLLFRAHSFSLKHSVGVLIDLLTILFRHDYERESACAQSMCKCSSPCGSVCPCVSLHICVGNTDGLSCCNRVKKKKKPYIKTVRMCWA